MRFQFLLERMFIILFGALVTHYFTFKLMYPPTNPITKSREQDIKQNKAIEFDFHEKSLLNDVFMPKDLQVHMTDVTGLRDQKQLILDVMNGKPNQYFKRSEKIKGCIMHGSPGTGKTILAQAIAKHLNVPIIHFNIASIENKLFGESNKYLQAVFSLSEKLQPCIVFIDEMDCFGGTRTALDSTHVNNMKAMMLTKLDGCGTHGNDVFFIGATNRLNSIDAALRRRMPLHLEIPLPNKQDIKEYLSNKISVSESILDEISDVCLGLSFSDINALCYTVSVSKTTSEQDLVALFNDSSF